VFAGHESGARLAESEDGKLLLSVGDYQFDGVNADQVYAQDPSTDYGKIIEIDMATGQKRHISSGHRNPQGLFVDAHGRLWSTEHGPQGGDELNVIEEGSNYGWPNVSLGVDKTYGYWPLAMRQGRHDGYRAPVFAWLPSIAVGQLIQIQNMTEEWDGDLLIATLVAKQLIRIRLDHDHVQYAEPILMDQRIRDIIQDDRGTIWLWSDNGKLIRVRAGPSRKDTNVLAALSGPARAVVASCTECHELGSGVSSRISLFGVVGRKVASLTDQKYSKELLALGGSWTEERLDAFLKSPQTLVPGTAMTYTGISDDEIRSEVVRFLASLKATAN
jgi:cytochrome c2